MKASNAAVLTPTAMVRASFVFNSAKGTLRAIDFRAGADHIQGRRGVDFVHGGVLITLKANHRIGVQRAVAE